MKALKPITEAGFTIEPLSQEYYDYARNTVGSFLNKESFKWQPGRSGMTLDDFVMETVLHAIDITKKDYAKGLLRQEKETSFKEFYYWRIFKAYQDKKEELKKDPQKASFDESLGAYYEGEAADLGPSDDDAAKYYYSEEKAEVLEESRKIKMRYAKIILDAVSKMTPSDQRLFYLKYQIDFSKEDCQMWNTIDSQKHVKDPFAKMAHEKFDISEGYAKKRISLIKAGLIARLNQSGYSQTSYRQNTSMPGMLQMIVAAPRNPLTQLNIEELSEADCRDILMELFY